MSEYCCIIYAGDPIEVEHSNNTKYSDKELKNVYKSVFKGMLWCSHCNIIYEGIDEQHSRVIFHVTSLNGYCFLTDCCKHCKSKERGIFIMYRGLCLFDTEGNRRKISYYNSHSL